MSYSTYFIGEFSIDKPLDDETFKLLDGLSKTRRMKRSPAKLAKRLNMTRAEVVKKYGKECEFYYPNDGNMGQEHTDDIIDYNKPPECQPSLWCQWEIDKDTRDIIRWDEVEKFYEYVEWIEYFIDSILKPRDYVVNGEVRWDCEESTDNGTISIENNIVTVKEALTFYLSEKDRKRVSALVTNYLDDSLKPLIDHKLDKVFKVK